MKEALGLKADLPCYLSPDFMNVYYQIRSSQLDRSIKGLKEHFRKSSSSSGVPYSPAIPNKRKDTPTKKPIKRPGECAPELGLGPAEGPWSLDRFVHSGVASQPFGAHAYELCPLTGTWDREQMSPTQ